MATEERRRADRTEQAIEATLRPGRLISYAGAWSFIEGPENVAAQVTALVRSSLSRAVTLYGTFLAGCHEKADELDESSGGFGSFVGSLFCGWATARQAAGTEPSLERAKVR